MSKVEEAQEVLSALGLPTAQQNEPDLPVNSPKAHYAVSDAALSLIQKYGTPEWELVVADYYLLMLRSMGFYPMLPCRSPVTHLVFFYKGVRELATLGSGLAFSPTSYVVVAVDKAESLAHFCSMG